MSDKDEPVFEIVSSSNEPAGEIYSGPRIGQSQFDANTLIDVIENYLRYYAHGDSHTARAKRYDLEHFIKFLAGGLSDVSVVKVSDWTMQRTKDFVDDRLAQGESPATVSRRLATIKHFGRTIAERLPGYVNPAREVKSPSFLVSKPHGLSKEEIEALKEAAHTNLERKGNKFSVERNRFLLLLLLYTGLRADEVRLLTYGQITDDHRWCRNVKTKGRRFRNVYLDEEIRKELDYYLVIRSDQLKEKYPAHPALDVNPKVAVLVSTYKSNPLKPETLAMSPKSIWNAVSEFGLIASKANNKIKLHPHRLRHTFAHGLLDSSLDIRLVAQALGHSDVRTTMRYTERSEEQLAVAIERSRKS
jgi:site-specific recombinase XerD